MQSPAYRRTGRPWRGASLLVGMLLAGVALLGGAGNLAAQNTVSLMGHVSGSDGKPLAGAQVSVRNTETGQQRGAVTRADGTYSVVGLEPGPYQVKPVMIGYAEQVKDIRLIVGQRVTLNFTLQEQAVAMQGIDVVTNREPTFEVQRTDVSVPVVTAEIVNLPLNTRNTMNLAAIVPGVKTYAPTAGRSLPASGSLPENRFWNFYLDGAEWKSFFNGNLVGIPQTGSPLPQEAMREFRVHLNPYDAAFTRGASYIISAASQRGTNDWHGSAFVYGQNNDLNALDKFQRAKRDASPDTYTRPDYQRMQFGFNLRGPIRKDKLFMAVSYEGQQTDNNIAVIPGRPAYNPGIWDAYAGSFKAPTKNHTGVARITALPNELHKVDFTWAARNYESETNYGDTGARESGILAKYWIHSGQLRDTYTPTPNLVNEASLNFLYWNHQELQLVPGLKTYAYPSLQIGTAGFPLELKESTFRLIDRLTYTIDDGRHTLTGGAELARVNVDAWLPSNRDGYFQFATDTSTLPRLGRIGYGVLTGTDEDAGANSKGWSTGLYLQDQWQVTPRFQLTGGVRWDAELNTLNNDFESPFAQDTVLQKIPQLAGFLNNGNRKNDLNNFSPRVSFSWDVLGTGETFLRGGAGIMFDRIATFMAFYEKQSAGWRSFEFQNPGTTDPAELLARVKSGQGATKPNLTLMKTDMQTPYNQQFSLGLGQQITETLAFNADYVHQSAHNLYVSVTPNWYNTVTKHRNLTDAYGSITLYDDSGDAQFDALVGNLTYDRPGLRLTGSYTLGWYKSEFEGLGSYNDGSFFVMQPSSGDERARVVLSGIGDLPYGFRGSVVGIFATPRPYVATVGQDLNNDNVFTNDFVNGVESRVIRPESSWENLYRTVDMRLSKAFKVRSGQSVSVSLEAFNVFNWDNTSGYFGRQKDAAGNALANYGTPSGVYAPRQAQVGLRYEF